MKRMEPSEALLGLVFFVIFVIADALKMSATVEIPPKWEVVIVQDTISRAEPEACKSLLCLLESKGILFPRIVFTQSLLETGFFTSKIFLFNRNPFGMKVSSRNFHIKVNSLDYSEYKCYDEQHACYKNVYDAVQDLKAWQQIRLRAYAKHYGRMPSTEEEYLHFLNHLVIGKGIYRYAEDINYTAKLKRIINKYGNTNLYNNKFTTSEQGSLELSKNQSSDTLDSFDVIKDTILRWPNGTNLEIIYRFPTK